MTDHFQSVIMLCIGVLCWASALEWWLVNGAGAAGFTFVGFAIGYFALAALFAGIGS